MTHHLLAALLTLPLLAACGGVEPDPIDRPGPQQLPAGDLVAVDLPPPFAEGDQLRASFEDGEVSFQATCNTMSGAVSLAGDILVVDSLGGTEIGCPGAGYEQDKWLVDFFTSRPTLDTRDAGFSLQSELADLVLLPPEAASGDDDQPLEGTRWKLTGLEQTDGDAVSMTPVPPGAAMRIDGDEITFATGCNNAEGRVEAQGQRLRLSGMGITQRGCGGSPAVESAQVRVVMSRTLTWSIDTDTLRLTRGDTTLLYRSG